MVHVSVTWISKQVNRLTKEIENQTKRKFGIVLQELCTENYKEWIYEIETVET